MTLIYYAWVTIKKLNQRVTEMVIFKSKQKKFEGDLTVW